MDYHTRIKITDDILNIFSTDNKIKFLILSLFHYIFLTIFYFYILFTKNKTYLITLLFLFLTQLIFNIFDKGCFLMKLERKYIGKDWYGIYSLFLKNVSVEFCNYIYIILNIIGIFLIFLKLRTHFFVHI